MSAGRRSIARAHIGNARAAVVYDVLYRVLRRHYDTVVYARNITDIDDKINAAAQEQGVPIAAITARYVEVYHRDMDALGVLAPVIEPRATDHIDTIIAMIEQPHHARQCVRGQRPCAVSRTLVRCLRRALGGARLMT